MANIQLLTITKASVVKNVKKFLIEFYYLTDCHFFFKFWMAFSE